jgi:hypothetical protein
MLVFLVQKRDIRPKIHSFFGEMMPEKNGRLDFKRFFSTPEMGDVAWN